MRQRHNTNRIKLLCSLKNSSEKACTAKMYKILPRGGGGGVQAPVATLSRLRSPCALLSVVKTYKQNRDNCPLSIPFYSGFRLLPWWLSLFSNKCYFTPLNYHLPLSVCLISTKPLTTTTQLPPSRKSNVRRALIHCAKVIGA